MIDTNTKEEMITKFSHFLEDISEEELTMSDSSVDLYTLFKEFISLKTEIKHESRQFKNALDSFKDVFTTLQRNSDVLTSELAQRRREQSQEIEIQKRKILKPLLLDLLELRDSIEAGVISSQNYRPHFLSSILKHEKALIASMNEGQSMTMRRLDQLLVDHGVVSLHVLHQQFNPMLMRAVAVESCQTLSSGVVTVEVRKGYMWNEELLRLAEVKVNKIEEI
jgi:molecular chaperone GrpE